MKIESVRIENLRSFKDETVVFNDFTCLVGPNGSGKSTVLCALNIFFRKPHGGTSDPGVLEKADFHREETSNPIRITVTFADLSPDAQTDLKDYVRSDKLIVTAEACYNEADGVAKVNQHGQRLGMRAFAPFFEQAGDSRIKAADLKKIYEQVAADVPDLPKWTSTAAAKEALRKHEAEHSSLCELLRSDDQFYGFTKGVNRLAPYIQWVFVPAVKDAVEEQTEARNTAIGELVERVVRAKVSFDSKIKTLRDEALDKYRSLLASNQSALTELSTSLNTRLREWAHPDASLEVVWGHDPDKGVVVSDPVAEVRAGEGCFRGTLCRFGHGLQRAYLLALLQELASIGPDGGPRLVLGCEEPELYQHPPQARHMADVLRQLSTENSQIVVTTHSPYFVSGDAFADVRLVRKDASSSTHVVQTTPAELAERLTRANADNQDVPPQGVLAKIHQELRPEVNEMFFTPTLVLVEGLEDVAYITSHLHLSGKWDDWRRLGCHIVQPGGKSNIVRPLAIARLLKIPVFVVFDADGGEENASKRNKHKVDNSALLNLCEAGRLAPFPTEHVWRDDMAVWKTNLTDAVKADFVQADWDRLWDKANAAYGQIGNLKKNGLVIAHLLESARGEGKGSATLERLCAAIIEFAKRQQTPAAEPSS